MYYKDGNISYLLFDILTHPFFIFTAWLDILNVRFYFLLKFFQANLDNQ